MMRPLKRRVLMKACQKHVSRIKRIPINTCGDSFLFLTATDFTSVDSLIHLIKIQTVGHAHFTAAGFQEIL